MGLLPEYEDLCQVIYASLPDEILLGLGLVPGWALSLVQAGPSLVQVGPVPAPS